MRIGYSIKSLSVILVVLLLIGIAVLPAVSWARTEARYELISGDAIFGNDLGQVNSKQSLFHQQTLDTEDLETLNISFPLNANDLGLGPSVLSGGISADGFTAGGTDTANVLPFGPVNLAFPDITQTVFQSYGASSTGFYTATFLGIPPINPGGSPVTTGIFASQSPVSPSSNLIGSYMMFPEMNNIIPGFDQTKAASKSSNTSAKNSTNSSANSSANSGPGFVDNESIQI